MADDAQQGTRFEAGPASEPVSGVVVRPATQMVPVQRPALVARARDRLVELARNPGALATAAVGATVVTEVAVQVARRMLSGPAPANVEIRGTVVHHVVHHHVVHILDARRALPPA